MLPLCACFLFNWPFACRQNYSRSCQNGIIVWNQLGRLQSDEPDFQKRLCGVRNHITLKIPERTRIYLDLRRWKICDCKAKTKGKKAWDRKVEMFEKCKKEKEVKKTGSEYFGLCWGFSGSILKIFFFVWFLSFFLTGLHLSLPSWVIFFTLDTENSKKNVL